VEAEHRRVRVSFRNDSDKVITAFSVVDGGGVSRHELIDSDRTIPPGATTIETYLAPSTSGPATEITVVAVVYEDATSDRMAKYLNLIIDARAGRQVQLAHFLDMLENEHRTSTSSRHPRDEGERLKYLETQVASLPETESGKSFEFTAALHSEREALLGKIRELQKIREDRGDDVAKAVLMDMQRRYREKNAILLRALQAKQQ